MAATAKHPRLFFDAADLPRLRAKLEHPDCRRLWSRLLAGCEAMLSAAPDPLFPRHVRASHMAFASLMTGRTEFGDVAIAMCRRIAERPRYIEPRAGEAREGVGLATGGAVNEMMLVYDWLHDRLDADLRQRIVTQVCERGFAANRYDFDRRFPASSWHNCNGMNVINGPLLAAAILLEEVCDTRDGFALSLAQIRRSIASFCPDGGYHEGPLYWNYGVRHMLLGVEALRRHKGVDLYHEPFLRHTGDYILHHVLPWLDHCANSADSDDVTHAWAPIARLASYHRRPDWQWLARRMATHDWPDRDGETLEYSLFFLLWYDPDLPGEPPAPSQRTHLFSGLQTLSSRSDWSDRATHLLWLNGPSNCSHNHLHLNSFTLSAFGQRLLVEMGKFDYSNGADPRRHTQGHNSLLVDGQGQVITTDDSIWCKRLRAGEWGTVFGEFRCLREEADSPIATGSVVNAYPGKLRTFDRTIAFVERRFVFLHDFIELAKTPPTELSWLFHAHEHIDLHVGGVTFRSGNARLHVAPHCKVPLRCSIGTDQARLKSKAAFDPYLRVDATCAGSTIDFYALLAPVDGDVVPVMRIGPHADGVEFIVDGRSWVYEYRTRSIRRAEDEPLPRRVV